MKSYTKNEWVTKVSELKNDMTKNTISSFELLDWKNRIKNNLPTNCINSNELIKVMNSLTNYAPLTQSKLDSLRLQLSEVLENVQFTEVKTQI